MDIKKLIALFLAAAALCTMLIVPASVGSNLYEEQVR